MSGVSKKSLRTKANKKNSKQSNRRNTKKRKSKKQKKAGIAKSKTTHQQQQHHHHNTSQTTHTTSKTVTPTKEKSPIKNNNVRGGGGDEFKEKEPESEGKKGGERGAESISKSKGSQGLPSSQIEQQQQKKVEVKNRDPDEDKMKRLLSKLKKDKNAPKPPKIEMDEKSKILMDRVPKKPYPLKYMSKSKEELLLLDEKSSFFKPSIPSHNSQNSKKPSEVVVEDTYDNYPKLSEVLKKPPQEVFNDKGVPFWAEYTEPTDNDLINIEPPISVGSDHLEMFHDRKLILKTIKDMKVVMDVYQPMAELIKRDDLHFHPHLVFSNTVRSLINVQNVTQNELASGSQNGKNKNKNKKEEKKEEVKTPINMMKVKIPPRSPEVFVYLRSDPIGSAHDVRKSESKTKNTTMTTTTDTV